MKKVVLILDDDSKNKLMLSYRNFIPDGWIKQIDHMLIKQDDDLMVNGVDWSHIIGKRYELLSTGFGMNKFVCCARIVPPTELLHLRLNVRNNEEPYFPYIVLAVNKTLAGKPSQAESIDKFTLVESVMIVGTVEVVDT